MSTPTLHSNNGNQHVSETCSHAASGRGGNDNVSVVTASARRGGVWGSAAPQLELTRNEERGTRSGAKWISRMFSLVAMLTLVLLQNSCMVAGEKEVNPLTGANRTSVLAMLGTDVEAMSMPFRNANGELGAAVGVNQSTGLKTVAMGAVGLATISAYKAIETGSQGVTKALSKDNAGATKAIDGNATKVLINDSNNALKEAELLAP